MPASVAPPPSVARPLIEHAGLAELVEADRGRVGARRAERAVDLRLAPGGDLRHHRQDDRRRVAPRRFLERLRADQHADVEQDRQDRDHRDQASISEMMPNQESTITITPVAAE